MGVPQVDENQLEQIGDYVKTHIGEWIREQNIFPFPPQNVTKDTELIERMVRVEEGLKNQIELTRQGFVSMEKRFETMDKRFEDLQSYMDKRFSHQQWTMGILFTLLTALISLFNFL